MVFNFLFPSSFLSGLHSFFMDGFDPRFPPCIRQRTCVYLDYVLVDGDNHFKNQTRFFSQQKLFTNTFILLCDHVATTIYPKLLLFLVLTETKKFFFPSCGFCSFLSHFQLQYFEGYFKLFPIIFRSATILAIINSYYKACTNERALCTKVFRECLTLRCFDRKDNNF